VEDVASEEAQEKGIRAEVSGRGLLRFARDVSPAGLLQRLRCIEDVRVLVATGPSLEQLHPARVPDALRTLLRGAALLERWREWLVSEAHALRYRFSLDNVRLPQSAFRAVLASVRDVLRELGMVDSASSYSALLRVDCDKTATRVWFVPTFEGDERFAYRTADVGAAIHPVVGASLARLVRAHERGTVVDPTCGSGTLLIERAFLDPEVALHGIDISPTAISAAAQNTAAPGLQSRMKLQQGDAGDRRVWPSSCVEVIANLPFGVRSARMDRDLAADYSGVDRLTQELLVAGGRALFYTSNRRLMDTELRKAPRLKRIGERTIASGGIDVHAWLVAKQ
jgi:Predicted N6-adenine-specific DNA methylase